MTQNLSSLPIDFFSLSREELGEFLSSSFGLPAYRATQLFQWVYKRGVVDLSDMTDLGRGLREELADKIVFRKASIKDLQVSKDGSRKYLLEVSSGVLVEAVMIRQPTRMTLCVSSQIGCGMGCAFCRTATMGFQGNLSSGDIVRQVLAVRDDAVNFGDMFHNIVFMGMGEPLHNYSNVVRAIRVLLANQ